MSKMFTLQAGPVSWGPKVQIQSVFGANVWCTFSIAESNAGGPILFQYWSSDTKKWNSAVPGQKLVGQSVWLVAKSAGTGGFVNISVTGTAITAAVLSLPLMVKTLVRERDELALPLLKSLWKLNENIQELELTITPEGGDPIIVDPNDRTATDPATGHMETTTGPGEEVTIEFPGSIENQAGEEPESSP